MNKVKIFLDMEKETKWINSMCEQGFRLVSRKWFDYSFERCKPGQYVYQIEKRKCSDAEKEKDKDYISFLSDLNINMVASQWGWYYFEKENNEKSFEIYSDIPSKINHYKRLIRVLLIVGFFSLCLLGDTLNSPGGSQGPYVLNISVPIVANTLIILTVIKICIKYLLRVKKLRNENSIVE